MNLWNRKGTLCSIKIVHQSHQSVLYRNNVLEIKYFLGPNIIRSEVFIFNVLQFTLVSQLFYSVNLFHFFFFFFFFFFFCCFFFDIYIKVFTTLVLNVKAANNTSLLSDF